MIYNKESALDTVFQANRTISHSGHKYINFKNLKSALKYEKISYLITTYDFIYQ
jgi:hypothetical protein